ncbi:MAG: IS110 family transposase [Acidimicrobiia bacterium]
MKVRVGIDIACRSPHQAAIADETGTILSSRHRFRTVAAELEAFWDLIPSDAEEVLVVMEPTRNAWVPLAAWFRRQGARVVMVPSEQSADLRDYMSKDHLQVLDPLRQPSPGQTARASPSGPLVPTPQPQSMGA